METNWKNKLVIERNDDSEFKDAVLGIDSGASRWYHITVRNIHKDEMAGECASYVKTSAESFRKTNLLNRQDHVIQMERLRNLM